MKFFEVFKINTDDELSYAFLDAEVVSVNKLSNTNSIRVKIDSPEISNENIRLMEETIKTGLLEGLVNVEIINVRKNESPIPGGNSLSSAFFAPEASSDYEYAEPGSGSYARQSTDTQQHSEASNGSTPRKQYGQQKTYTRKKKKTDEGMLYGSSFEGEPVRISDLEGARRNVIINGEIFENELITTKKGTKFLKLALTDNEDSIGMKMFLNEGEEELEDILHVGLQISVCGRVDFDNFEGELVLGPVTGIKETKLSLNKRMDDSEEKRVELHLHTRYSDMDAITDVEAMIKQAVKWGHKSVAITDHGVVQGFTDAFHVLRDMKGKDPDLNFKIIYGMEAYLVDDSDMPIVRGVEEVDIIRSKDLSDGSFEMDQYMADAISNVKKKKYYHAVLLAKNEIGRINLYRLVSLSHINYFNRRPRIPKSVLSRYREGLILGSACVIGELYDAALDGRSDAELDEIARFYDYLEVQPLGNNEFLIREYAKPNRKGHALKDFDAIKDVNRKIIEIGDRLGKKVVATGDVHFLNPEDKLYRSILEDGMKYDDADFQGPFYLHTTQEMLDEFSYLSPEKAHEIVIENSNYIADQIEYIEPVRPDKCPPVIENSDQQLRDICYATAISLYGDPIPSIVKSRLDKELDSIISNGYSVMYIIARELVQKSVSDGYLVGSRGSVGSSLVATMSEITEVNPLPPHYRCKKCKYSDFESDVVKSFAGGSGCDMPDRICPVCGEPLYKDGFDIPFETFLGFKGDKEPDIDLNFSGEYQSEAHDYTEVIFGKGHTFKAGTISTLQDKTAYGFVKNYMEHRGRPAKKCEMNRLVKGMLGVKRSTGQHPGGIVVLPHGEEIYSFTPVQYPANDATKNVVTTHFEYHSIDHNLLKLDILGHDDPTMIKVLEDLTGTSAKDVRLDDPAVMKLFESPEIINLTPEEISGYRTGTLGIPEFGTDFVIGMLLQTKPKNFSDLVRIAGLSHGTDVWLSNAETLIKEGKATLSSCICTRDDIMMYLISKGVEPAMSFNVMEAVRKGKVAKGKEKRWEEWEKVLKEHNVPDWYLWSCTKIQYMFPKAHAVAYVMMAYRIAYYKIYYPLAYYAAFFSIRASSFDYELMCQGKDKLVENMQRIQARIDDGTATPKDSDLLKYMYNCLEMYARGFEFMPIDLYRAKASRFQIIDNKIMPAFASIDGMGDKASQMLEEEAAKEHFTSREDLKIRTRLSSTLTDKLYTLGILKDMPASSQMSIMDFLKF